MRNILYIVCIWMTHSMYLYSNTSIDVCVAHGQKITNIEFKVYEHSFQVLKGGQSWLTASKGSLVRLFVEGGVLKITCQGNTYSVTQKIELKRNEWSASLKVNQSNVSSLKNRVYQDQLFFELQAGGIRIINRTYIDHYVAGVVEAESGAQQNLEYYKVQSVICRTYALANLRRHEQEGFQLCDRVHCQVFKGKARYSNQIQQATQFTKNLVLVDRENKLANASFHSNCGGQTANSEDVWTYGLSHLKSICDPFCTNEPHAYWQRKIPVNQWVDYFRDSFKMNVEDPILREKILNHTPDGRSALFLPTDTIKMKHLREDWRLPSALFTYRTDMDSVVIQGSGFGHGVGLCQEGAMRMSTMGYTYADILAFYYQNVQIVALSQAILPKK